MPIETGSFISSLNPANPPSNDPKSEGDNHLRFIKEKIVETFPNVDGAVTASPGELNILDGATLDTAELNVLDGVTASTAEINLLDGVTSTTDEINSIHLKANIDSPTLTGTPKAPTGAAGSGGTQIATQDYVNSTILNVSLPGQAGNAGALMQTDGTNANWTKTINGGVVKLLSGGDIVGTTEAQTLTNKTINQKDALFTLQDDADITKQAKFECSAISTGTTRIITMPNENITLGDSSMKLIQTFTTLGGSNTWEISNVFSSAYDVYIFEFWNLIVSSSSVNLYMQFKAGGAYLTTGYYTTNAAFTGTEISVSGLSVSHMTYGYLKFYSPGSNISRKMGLNVACNTAQLAISPTSSSNFGNLTALPLEGFKFYISSQTITAGGIGKLYGFK